MSCRSIVWVSTLIGSIGIGVFEDDYGKITVRAAPIPGNTIEQDTEFVNSWGGRIPIDELERLLRAAKEVKSAR